MIKTLTLNNFRTWKNAVLNFCSGVNVIVGLPDSGKTNILKAINWVNDNRPSGSRMQSDFSSDLVNVTIEVDEDRVKLEKPKNKVYWLNDQDFKAIGQGVPDLIKKALNLSELNIQKQFDKPYLITDNPAEITREMDKITRLEYIEEWITILTSKVNSGNRDIRQLKADVEDYEKRIKDFGDLDSIDKKLQDIEYMQNTLDNYDKQISKAESLISQYRNYEWKLKEYKIPEGLENKIELALKDLQEIKEAENKLRRAQLLKEKHSSIRIIEIPKDIGSELESALDDLGRIKELDRKISQAQLAMADFDARFKNMQYGKKQSLELIREYKEFIKTLSKCPYCEFCNTDIKSHSFERLLDECEA